MKLVLLTNMPSYHQAQLGEQLAAQLGEHNFRLVFAEPTSDSREEMGWKDQYSANHIIRMWESAEQQQQVEHWIETADVVVQGRFPMAFVRGRINAGKLTFAYQERFWKRPFSWARVLTRLPRIWRRYWSVNKPNYHLLAAGAYVAPDLEILGCFKKRAWKFGYFIDHTPSASTRSENELTLLWCARFSPVKRAADAIEIFRQLLRNGVTCRLIMVGDGEQRGAAEQLASDLGDAIRFVGWQSAEKVDSLMREADVFLMTSAFGEGWALVVNEAIRAGCMVVANRQVGAVPWLIEHKTTGLIYEQDDLPHAAQQLAQLSPSEIRRMGQLAQQRHEQLWSTTIAAERLIGLSAALLVW